MLPRGRVYRYPPARNMPDVPPMPGVAGGMIQSYDMGGFPVRDAGLSPAPIGTLTSALANANPEQQRTVCPNYIPLLVVCLIYYSFCYHNLCSASASAQVSIPVNLPVYLMWGWEQNKRSKRASRKIENLIQMWIVCTNQPTGYRLLFHSLSLRIQVPAPNQH